MISVLHVEDEKSVIQMVREMLRDEYDYTAVTSLKEALEIIKTEKIDVILLDLKLSYEQRLNGDFRGVKLLKELSEQHKKIKVILVSALSEESKKAKLEHPSFVKATVSKPFRKKQLVDAIIAVTS